MVSELLPIRGLHLESNTTRRDLLKRAGLLGAASLLPSISLGGRHHHHHDRLSRRNVLRIAHFTDPHISPEGPSAKWLAKALEHANSLPQRPNMILFGGDMVLDGTSVSKSRMAAQWKTFHDTVRDHNSLPVNYCIGNHDVWGWFSRDADSLDRQYGKQWVQDGLSLNKPYYSMDRNGWHIVVLDSIHRHKGGYVGKLDEEQIAWLDADLAAHASMPTLVTSHIPLMSACAGLVTPRSETDGSHWHVSGAHMHIDGRRIKDVFVRHSNVNLCISGHVHLLEGLQYNGIGYASSGSVSGNWWKGNFQETPPGYALVDLFEDGSWHHDYVTYGWSA